MIEKIIVRQNEDSRFMIVHHDRETDIEKFFAGFYNETECPGTENESFCHDCESWVERPEDGAVMFKSYNEANAYLDWIQEDGDDCAVVLYGKSNRENTILGSYWYPLKIFKKGDF